jgi:hypothetical protein
MQVLALGQLTLRSRKADQFCGASGKLVTVPHVPFTSVQPTLEALPLSISATAAQLPIVVHANAGGLGQPKNELQFHEGPPLTTSGRATVGPQFPLTSTAVIKRHVDVPVT